MASKNLDPTLGISRGSPAGTPGISIVAARGFTPDNVTNVCYADYPYSRYDTGTAMSNQCGLKEYMVISKGRWDEDKSPDEIQHAIDAFYDWHDRLVSAGKMK